MSEALVKRKFVEGGFIDTISTDPLVSVIMPWLDRSPQMMRRAVASVEAQTYRNYELITRKAVVGRTVGYMRNLCVRGASVLDNDPTCDWVRKFVEGGFIDTISTDPLVSVIMLTRDRPEMARRAVECFRAQTYERKKLLVYDTTTSAKDRLEYWRGFLAANQDMGLRALVGNGHNTTIGAMRNYAIRDSECDGHPEIIAHWDDDDHSHPNRLAEQVALLQASGADCVGYRDMLFFDETPGHPCGAWLYTNPIAKYALGTSLMYWRRTWERVPFDDVMRGEDERFCRKVGNVVAVSSIPELPADYVRPDYQSEVRMLNSYSPRMIASVHGGNTSSRIAVGHQQFKRVPEWDAFCREKMRLEVVK